MGARSWGSRSVLIKYFSAGRPASLANLANFSVDRQKNKRLAQNKTKKARDSTNYYLLCNVFVLLEYILFIPFSLQEESNLYKNINSIPLYH